MTSHRSSSIVINSSTSEAHSVSMHDHCKDMKQIADVKQISSEKNSSYNTEKESTDLLMIGKTGNGKSSLGNTILRKKAFNISFNATSDTRKVKVDKSDFGDRVIKVVDGPGVGDTRMDSEYAKTLVMNAMSYAIAANPDGYHAFLLVVKSCDRFTSEDKATLDFLKHIFGESFVREFCILVVTYGDIFEQQCGDLSFRDWCGQQVGNFGELLKECENRVLLVDNCTQNEDKIVKQINDLVEMVDNLKAQGKRYKDENFEKAQNERDRILREAKMTIVPEKTMTEASIIIQKLKNIQLIDKPWICKTDLERLLTRADLLYDSIKPQDKGTGALHKLVEIVNSLKGIIQDEITLLTVGKMKDAMKRVKEIEEHEQRLHVLIDQHISEKEKSELKITQIWEEKRNKYIKRVEELENQYQNANVENNEGLLDRIAEFIYGLLRKLF